MKPNRKPTPTISRPAPKRRPNWQYYTVTVLCCAVLFAGFFLAARQHFSSMEYGLQNSRLRRQIDELQAEKRRLLLNREVTLTPNELKKAVRRMGFVDDTVITKNEPTKPGSVSAQNAVVKTAEVLKPNRLIPVNKIIPTVINSPVNKTTLTGKVARRESVSPKKDRT